MDGHARELGMFPENLAQNSVKIDERGTDCAQEYKNKIDPENMNSA